MPVVGADPEGGRDRLGRHVDAVVEGEAPELRLQVDAVHHPAEAAGPAGDLLRRDAGQQEGVRGHGHAREGLVRAVLAPTRPRAYYRSIKFWKTPIADCGNGQKNCMDLRAWTTPGSKSRASTQAFASVDDARSCGGLPRRGALRSLSRFSWRRPGLKTLGQISAPVAAFLFVYVAALVALLIQGFWTTDSFTGKVDPLVEPRQLPRDRERRPTRRSSCARSGWRPP